jgi:hypothetical protein
MSLRDWKRTGLAWTAVAVAAIAACMLPAGASASEPLPDNISKPTLEVNAKGEALVSFGAAGAQRHILVWGAVNGVASSAGGPQQQFSRDNAGGYGKYHDAGYWKTFTDACSPYDGPPLVYMVAACKAPDGSYWALQSWQRDLPDLGFAPWKASQRVVETDISHWTGPLATLSAVVDWTHGHSSVGIFGQLLYGGKAVFGGSVTAVGSPTDVYGRNVYIDTFDSAYGAGWKRDSAILVHSPNGTFCHSFRPAVPFAGYPSKALRPAAPGSKYRITVIGPGVTPVVQWEGTGIGPKWGATAADKSIESGANTQWDSFMTKDTTCVTERPG